MLLAERRESQYDVLPCYEEARRSEVSASRRKESRGEGGREGGETARTST